MSGFPLTAECYDPETVLAPFEESFLLAGLLKRWWLLVGMSARTTHPRHSTTTRRMHKSSKLIHVYDIPHFMKSIVIKKPLTSSQ